jgi:predicted amino acid dehydrogenase/acyl carrier protein
LVEAGKSKQIQGTAQNDWRATIRALPSEEMGAAVSDLVVRQLAATLSMAAAEIDPNERLTAMDSLMAVELKVRLESHAGCVLPIDLFNAELTPAQLADRLLQLMNDSVGEPESTVLAMPAATEAPVEIAAPLLRTEETPLVDLVRSGKIEQLTAAALMSWPDSLFEQSGVPSDFFFHRLNGGGVLFDLIFETSLGSIGIFMLPMRTSEVKPGAPVLLSHVVDGVSEASECGARCVALTGLIATATNYGAAVQAACSGNGFAALTTGHNTTIAAVVLNLAALLNEAGREMKEETVMFYGIGSIGLGALRLMLEVLPHPAELRLCDPFRSADFFTQLETTLRGEHRFEGPVRVLGANFRECYDATVIVGATNTANVLDVDRLAPGTLMVDDSAPHCLNGPAVLARFRREHDILCTEGGFVRSGKPMPRITHVPESVGQILPAQLPELFLSFLTPHDITACILSALLSARFPELSPTIGLAPPGASRSHWNILPELGFGASELNYEGTPLDARDIAAFRRRYGRVSDPAALREGI